MTKIMNNYNIKINSEFPPQVISKKLDKLFDTFTIIENIIEDKYTKDVSKDPYKGTILEGKD